RLEAREPGAVAPRGDLGQKRRSDAHELEAAAKASESDVVGRHAEPRAAEQMLRLVDCFPALLERREVPAATASAHHPQSALLRIERHAAADREGRQMVVRAEVRVAEKAAGIHRDKPKLGKLRGAESSPRYEDCTRQARFSVSGRCKDGRRATGDGRLSIVTGRKSLVVRRRSYASALDQTRVWRYERL